MSDVPAPVPAETRAVERPTTGLTCPRCGGALSVPDGQALVKCPYCGQASLVDGERGVPRYQVPARVDRAAVDAAFKRFLSGNMSIAFDAGSRGRVTEAFMVSVPFWASWGRVLGWVFGRKRVRSGKHTHMKPREIKITEDAAWTGPACDISEFGIGYIPLEGRPIEPYRDEELHARGMVFEPVGAVAEAREAAAAWYAGYAARRADLTEIDQSIVRLLNASFGLVFYPLWVLRYEYNGRLYQLVIDGYTGDVVYGRAPGNTMYRAGVLVGGMAVGSVLGVSVPCSLLLGLANSSGRDSTGLLVFAGVVALAGFGLMAAGYRAFRYGEVYELRKYRAAVEGSPTNDLFKLATEGVQQLLNQ